MNKKVLLIHSNAIPPVYLNNLQSILPCKVELYPLESSQHVYSSISAHPDIFMFQAQKNVLIASSNISNDLEDKLSEYNVKLIKAASYPTGKYPSSCILNASKIGNHIIHNTEHTANAIMEYSRNNNCLLINVKQGYSRCSIVPVSEKALITPDKGIAVKLSAAGMDVLLIRPEYVFLNGEKYGFLGGASGTFIDGSTVFLGDISVHPDFVKINQFFKKHSKEYHYLENLTLFDAGSLIFFEKQ